MATPAREDRLVSNAYQEAWRVLAELVRTYPPDQNNRHPVLTVLGAELNKWKYGSKVDTEAFARLGPPKGSEWQQQ